MEVDERLRWLEARISTSLRPRGDELRNLLTHEENRYVKPVTEALVYVELVTCKSIAIFYLAHLDPPS